MSSRNDSEKLANAKLESRLSRPKRWLLLVGGVLCLISWVALGLGLFMDAPRNTLLLLATFAALATEGLFWVAAAVLGITVFQARQRIWGWLSRRPHADGPSD